MALHNRNLPRHDLDRMMLDSGASYVMTPYSEYVNSKKKCNMSVTLDDAWRVDYESRESVL